MPSYSFEDLMKLPKEDLDKILAEIKNEEASQREQLEAEMEKLKAASIASKAKFDAYMAEFERNNKQNNKPSSENTAPKTASQTNDPKFPPPKATPKPKVSPAKKPSDSDDKFSYLLNKDNTVKKLTDLEVLNLDQDYFETQSVEEFHAYLKKLLLSSHPDKNPDNHIRASEAFKYIQAAVKRIKENIQRNGKYEADDDDSVNRFDFDVSFDINKVDSWLGGMFEFWKKADEVSANFSKQLDQLDAEEAERIEKEFEEEIRLLSKFEENEQSVVDFEEEIRLLSKFEENEQSVVDKESETSAKAKLEVLRIKKEAVLAKKEKQKEDLTKAKAKRHEENLAKKKSHNDLRKKVVTNANAISEIRSRIEKTAERTDLITKIFAEPDALIFNEVFYNFRTKKYSSFKNSSLDSEEFKAAMYSYSNVNDLTPLLNFCVSAIQKKNGHFRKHGLPPQACRMATKVFDHYFKENPAAKLSPEEIENKKASTKNLKLQIKSFHKFGKLKNSELVTKLTEDLEKDVEQFITSTQSKEEFRAVLLTRLHSQDDVLNKKEVWVYIVNIAIACITVGVAHGINLIYTKKKTGDYTLLFFDKNKAQKQVLKISHELDEAEDTKSVDPVKKMDKM